MPLSMVSRSSRYNKNAYTWPTWRICPGPPGLTRGIRVDSVLFDLWCWMRRVCARACARACAWACRCCPPRGLAWVYRAVGVHDGGKLPFSRPHEQILLVAIVVQHVPNPVLVLQSGSAREPVLFVIAIPPSKRRAASGTAAPVIWKMQRYAAAVVERGGAARKHLRKHFKRRRGGAWASCLVSTQPLV